MFRYYVVGPDIPVKENSVIISPAHFFKTHEDARTFIKHKGCDWQIWKTDLNERYENGDMVQNLLIIRESRLPKLPTGNRSFLMWQRLEEQKHPSFQGEMLVVDNLSYRIITAAITTGWCDLQNRFASVGSLIESREIIILDPNSERLKKYAQMLLRDLYLSARGLNEYQKLEWLLKYVVKQFPKKISRVAEIVNDWSGPHILYNGTKTAIIPVEIFLDEAAFCRHLVIMVIYSLGIGIANNFYDPGDANIIRYDSTNSGHAEVRYRLENGVLWILDATLLGSKKPAVRVIKEITDEEELTPTQPLSQQFEF